MNSANPEQLVNEILGTADRLFRLLLPAVPDEILTMDITMAQMKIMLILFIHGPQRMTHLATELDVTLPTATSLVDKLVDKGYVSRENQTDDRRVVLCKLSEPGLKTIRGIWEAARIRSRQLLEAMDVYRLEMFRDVLNDMLKTAGPKLAESSARELPRKKESL
ncbi:MAG TPA: MarR family transcriptional regulator [Dehalococcoidales bacterium]|nr:MarR family transcriptional regulator [Dehalococcoidales bacterium]